MKHFDADAKPENVKLLINNDNNNRSDIVKVLHSIVSSFLVDEKVLINLY